VRTEPWPPEDDHVPERLAHLAEVGAATGVTVLVPNHPGSRFGDPADLAAALAGLDEGHVAALLAPDQVARSRAGDHAEWLARLRLPPLGAVAVGNYRWDSEVGSGNIRLWSPRLATIYHGLTPWPAWLARIREVGFDGHFTFGDPSLSATVGERLRTVRDDLRFVRRVLQV
jgi:sugar phosphate isomerase/epimerase